MTWKVRRKAFRVVGIGVVGRGRGRAGWGGGSEGSGFKLSSGANCFTSPPDGPRLTDLMVLFVKGG